MAFIEELRQVFEAAEVESVGTSFGGTGGSKSFSIAKIRDWTVKQAPYLGDSDVEQELRKLYYVLPKKVFQTVVASAIRFSFLIELTDLKVGSTKMKTRWLPGLILMPQEGSFEPIQGTFKPGNDPRAASYEDCLEIFKTYCLIVRTQVSEDDSIISFFKELSAITRVPYEFPFGYTNPLLEPVHRPANVAWILSDDIRWLVQARKILRSAPAPHDEALRVIESKKLEVKVYKTDRALTGKDKTNRAKRWEVLAGDFQHATLEQCWSAERKLTTDLVHFEKFPAAIQDQFLEHGLIAERLSVARCPITLAPLNYEAFANSMLNAIHGRSDYQIGHLTPLKRGGRHTGSNVCWQSADGNRIQGDLKMDEVGTLLDNIARRRHELLGGSHTVSESE